MAEDSDDDDLPPLEDIDGAADVGMNLPEAGPTSSSAEQPTAASEGENIFSELSGDLNQDLNQSAADELQPPVPFLPPKILGCLPEDLIELGEDAVLLLEGELQPLLENPRADLKWWLAEFRRNASFAYPVWTVLEHEPPQDELFVLYWKCCMRATIALMQQRTRLP